LMASSLFHFLSNVGVNNIICRLYSNDKPYKFEIDKLKLET